MRKICRSSQFMTKILSEENVFQISTGVYVRIWTLPSHVKVLWVVSFPRCTAGPNINGSSCSRLHTQRTTANTEATTPNVVGPTMLGVLAPVCSNLQKKITGWRHVRPRQGRLGTLNEGVSEVVFGSAQLCNWGVTLFLRVKQAPDNFTGNSKHFFVIVG